LEKKHDVFFTHNPTKEAQPMPSPKKNSPTLRQERDAAQLAVGYLSITAAAKRLGVSPARAYALAQALELTSTKLGGSVYVQVSSIDAYKASRKAPPGWIRVARAVRLYHYGRSALLARAARGEVGRQVFGGRTHLKVEDLDSLAKTRLAMRR
jgi:hypothetical protein